MTLKKIYNSSRNFLYHFLCRNRLFYQLGSRKVGENSRGSFSLFTSNVKEALSQCSSGNTSPLKAVFADFFVLGEALDTIIEILYRLNNNLAFDLDKYHLLISELNSTPKSKLPPSLWKQLGYSMSCYALFQLSYLCYNKATEIALEERPNKKSYELAEECFALMEGFNIPRLLKLFDTPKFSKMLSSSYRLKFVQKHRLYDIELFLAVLTNNRPKLRELASKHFTEQDYAYLRYIEGKTVAIVGPAFSDSENGDEIDSFDVVVRLNHRAKLKAEDRSRIGSKINISYFNTQNIPSIRASIDKSFLDELDFYVLKSKNDLLAVSEDNLHSNKKRLNLGLHYAHMPNGFPNTAQHVLLDLILFRPKRIKIFYVNFFAASKSYRDGYKSKEADISGQNLFWSYTEHGLVSNLSLMRNLYHAGHYEPDDNMLQILKLTNEEYMKVMEDIYL